MKVKTRKLLFATIVTYTILTLYFMFLGFNRLEHVTGQSGYIFMLIPSGVLLRFPKMTFSWIYDFGNIAAFIPFGLLFPLLYRISFRKFITKFILVILALETIQSLTHLGTFDVDDVISNTIGAAIGYVVYRIGFSPTITFKKLIASALSVIVLLFGVMAMSESIAYTLEKGEALNNLEEQNGRMPLVDNIPSFTVAGETIKPKINLYSSENGESTTYTYNLSNKNDVMFYSTIGIADGKDFKGEVIIIRDGNIVVQYNEVYNQAIENLVIPLNNANEIKIIISGNAKLWDVGLSKEKH